MMMLPERVLFQHFNNLLIFSGKHIPAVGIIISNKSHSETTVRNKQINMALQANTNADICPILLLRSYLN